MFEREARNDSEGLLAICTECGTCQGTFAYEGELRTKMAEQGKCKNEKCNAKFSFLSDGRIWNLRWEIIPSKEEYAIKLLEQVVKQEQQAIFCYEDLGRGAPSYRYPQKRIEFHLHEKTECASPAYAINIFNKDKSRLEKSYCFDSPYALLQVAREALKGMYWLKYGKKTT